MSRRRLPVIPISAALVAAAALAVYPSSERGVGVFWLLIDLSLLFLAAHGRRWALTTLAYFSTLGAALFLLGGAWELGSDPRYFFRGVALAVASVLLIRARRIEHAGS